MKKLMMIALLVAFGSGFGFAQEKPDSETPQRENYQNRNLFPTELDVFVANGGLVMVSGSHILKSSDEAPTTIRYKLANIDAKEAAISLENSMHFKKTLNINMSPDYKTNSIVVTGQHGHHTRVRALLAQLDKPKVVRTSFTTPANPQDDLSQTNVELRIENAILKTKLEAMEEKMELVLKIAQLQAKLNEKETKSNSMPPTPPVFGSSGSSVSGPGPQQPKIPNSPFGKQTTPPSFGSPGPNVDGPGPMPPGFQPSNTFNPPRTNVPSKSTLNRTPSSNTLNSTSNGFSSPNTNGLQPPTFGEAKPAYSNPLKNLEQQREMASLRNAMLKLKRENQKQKLLIQSLQKKKK